MPSPYSSSSTVCGAAAFGLHLLGRAALAAGGRFITRGVMASALLACAASSVPSGMLLLTRSPEQPTLLAELLLTNVLGILGVHARSHVHLSDAGQTLMGVEQITM